MGQCPYVDDSASFLDGYHCTKIGGKVREYDITRCYCNSSVSYQYCPYLGGDDRHRRKPDPDPEPAPAPRTNPTYDTGDDYTPSPPQRSGSGGGGGGGSRSLGRSGLGCMGSLIVLMVVASLAIVLIMDWLGYNNTQIQVQLPDSVTAQAEDFSLRAICLDPENLYESHTEKFDETGFGRVFVEDGLNELYLEYDNVSYLLGTFTGSGSTIYTIETGDVERLLLATVRPLLITLENGAEESISPANFRVTDNTGKALAVIVLGEGQYAVLSSDGALASALTFSADDYEPLTVAVDQTNRITGLLVTLAETNPESGGGK